MEIADGLATREPGQLTFQIAKRNVGEILLVSEGQIQKAVFTVMEECHLVIEPSAAAAIAALIEKAKTRAAEKGGCCGERRQHFPEDVGNDSVKISLDFLGRNNPSSWWTLPLPSQ